MNRVESATIEEAELVFLAENVSYFILFYQYPILFQQELIVPVNVVQWLLSEVKVGDSSFFWSREHNWISAYNVPFSTILNRKGVKVEITGILSPLLLILCSVLTPRFCSVQ